MDSGHYVGGIRWEINDVTSYREPLTNTKSRDIASAVHEIFLYFTPAKLEP